MSSLFETPRAEPQPIWDRLPPDIRDVYTGFLRQYAQFIGNLGSGGFNIPPPPPVNISMPGGSGGGGSGGGMSIQISPPMVSVPGTVRPREVAPVPVRGLPPELVERAYKVLKGEFDPTTSPGVAEMIRRMEQGGRRATDMAMQRLAMAGQGPGTPMAQATAEIAAATGAQIGAVLQQVIDREMRTAEGLVNIDVGVQIANMTADLQAKLANQAADLQAQIANLDASLKAQIANQAASLQAQIASVQADLQMRRMELEAAIAQAQLELQRYGMVMKHTRDMYMMTLQGLQGAAAMATGILTSFLPPPQYGTPPIVGLLGPLGSILGTIFGGGGRR